MEPLKVFCETLLLTEFSVDPMDATTLFLFADEHNCVLFKRACLKVMQTHAATSIESEDFELLPEEIQTRLHRIKEGKKPPSIDKPKKTNSNNNNNQPKSKPSGKAVLDALGNPLKRHDKVQIHKNGSYGYYYYGTTNSGQFMKDDYTKQVGIIMGFRADGHVHVAL
eukprot:CAMPEP_0168563394 /NCGR_PEP_ID=MMETSP0413-20121227/12654_1 /TAXON_ID=136452 /ORGANISM="Filamoeba nolandi, Strain NC-AS-23-1" /LENGTH=166 /DNA_ID=CAMNT_0008594927 /DNA_START=1 /DNA_END=497 /DNA_ORIENTATION=-